MTLAIVKGVWVLALRSLAAALWVIEHAALAWGQWRAGERGARVWLVPVAWAWRSGRRFAAARWCLFLLAYGVLTIVK